MYNYFDFLIYFNLAKPTFTNTNQLVKVTEGSTVKVVCDVNASPTPKITWSPPPMSLGSRFDVNGTVITLTNASTADSAIFNCIATNALGSASKQTVLEVFSTYLTFNILFWMEVSVFQLTEIIKPCDHVFFPSLRLSSPKRDSDATFRRRHPQTFTL